MPVPAGLLQAATDEYIVPLVVLVILLGIGFLIMRAAADRITGVHDEEALYELVQGTDGQLGMEPATHPNEGTAISLDPDAMMRLTELVHRQNDLRVHTMELPDGEEIAFEDHDPSTHPPPRSILLEASKGTVRIGESGLLETNPPLDEAVRKDLLRVLDEILQEA